MAIEQLTIPTRAVGSGEPAADVNAVVAKVNEVVTATNTLSPAVFTALASTAWDAATESSKRKKTLTADTDITISNIPDSFAGVLFLAENTSYTLSINGTDITALIRETGETMVGIMNVSGIGWRYYSDLTGAVTPEDPGTPSTTAENIVWATRTVDNTDEGGGTVSTTFGGGSVGSKTLAKANGHFAEWIIPATVADGAGAILAIDDVAGIIEWSGSFSILAGAYTIAGNLYAHKGNSSFASVDCGAIAAGNVVRLEISGNNIILKVGSTTVYTFTDAALGLSEMYVKAMFVNANKKLNQVSALGLITV